MESEAALDYPRQLKAARISGSALILLLGILASWMSLKFSFFCDTFINSAEGGVEALPILTKTLVDRHHTILGGLAVVSIALQWSVWSARRLSTLIYSATAAVLVYALHFVLVDLAMIQPLITGLKKFQG